MSTEREAIRKQGDWFAGIVAVAYLGIFIAVVEYLPGDFIRVIIALVMGVPIYIAPMSLSYVREWFVKFRLDSICKRVGHDAVQTEPGRKECRRCGIAMWDA